MKMYKRVLPYVLAVMPLAMTSCDEGAIQTGVVLKIDDLQWYYCDKDGDKLADYRLGISKQCREMDRTCFTTYIQVGDTINFYYGGGEDIIGRSCIVWPRAIHSVNNRSRYDLYKIERVNEIRIAAGQPKIR